MTIPDVCGAAMFRCAACENAVAATLDTCPRCKSNDIEPSTCRRALKAVDKRCYIHGGRAPQVEAAAMGRKVNKQLSTMLETYDAGPCTDPFQALIDLAGEALAWKSLLGDRVARLRDEEWRWEGRTGEQTRAELALYERGMDRAARILADVTKLGLEERLLQFHVRIETTQAVHIGEAIEAVVDLLPFDLRRPFLSAVGGRLRSLETGSAMPPLPTLPDVLSRSEVDRLVRQAEQRGYANGIQDSAGVPNRAAEAAQLPREPLELSPAPVTAPEPQTAAEIKFLEDTEPVPRPVPRNVIGQVQQHNAESLREVFPYGRRGR